MKQSITEAMVLLLPPHQLPTPPTPPVPLTRLLRIEGCSGTCQHWGHGAEGALTCWRHKCACKDALIGHPIPNTPKVLPWGCFPAPGCQWSPTLLGLGLRGPHSGDHQKWGFPEHWHSSRERQGVCLGGGLPGCCLEPGFPTDSLPFG